MSERLRTKENIIIIDISFSVFVPHKSSSLHMKLSDVHNLDIQGQQVEG